MGNRNWHKAAGRCAVIYTSRVRNLHRTETRKKFPTTGDNLPFIAYIHAPANRPPRHCVLFYAIVRILQQKGGCSTAILVSVCGSFALLMKALQAANRSTDWLKPLLLELARRNGRFLARSAANEFNNEQEHNRMAEFTFCVALQAAILSTGANNYEQAYQDAAAQGKPLMVLVGADWCPGCRTMKQSTMPNLARRGRLSGVAFASVNTDHDGPLARKLMRGGTIPQLILFTKTSTGWKRMQLTGAQDESRVESMIRQGIELYAPAQSRELATAGGG